MHESKWYNVNKNLMCFTLFEIYIDCNEPYTNWYDITLIKIWFILNYLKYNWLVDCNEPFTNWNDITLIKILFVLNYLK